jgi:hypothetical protein
MKATCAKCQHVYFVHASSVFKGGPYNRCPRCGTPFSAAKGTIQSAERSWDTSGTHPFVLGIWAGAAGGTAGGILAVILSFLGFGFFFLDAQIPDAAGAMAMLIVFLRMVSLGILIGMSLTWVRKKTRVQVWGIIGEGVGSVAGALLGLIFELVAGIVTGADLVPSVIFRTVVGWAIKAAIVTTLAIAARRFVFSSIEEGSFLSPISISQQGIVGILCCVVVLTIGLEIKDGRLSQSARQEASRGRSSEGLVLRELQESINATGDLVIRGAIENTTKTDKAGWIAIAELTAEDGRVLRRATVINGLQMLNIDDLEILRKRGMPLSPLNLSEVQGYYVLKAGTSLPLKVIFYSPPEKYGQSGITLRDLDPKTVEKIISESLRDLKTIQDKYENGAK